MREQPLAWPAVPRIAFGSGQTEGESKREARRQAEAGGGRPRRRGGGVAEQGEGDLGVAAGRAAGQWTAALGLAAEVSSPGTSQL